MFIIIDGIDGAGKSTIVKWWANDLAAAGKKIFSLKEYWLREHAHPTLDEVRDADVILSAEPTNVWIGAAIRSEFIRQGAGYSVRSIADAFSLDRLVLYRRLIVPLLEMNKLVIQDRSVSTSLCYQPIQHAGLTIEDVAALEGNYFALQHAPDHLVIADLPAEVAVLRLGNRHTKTDDAIFEEQQFLTKARERFLSTEFQSHFTGRGASVHVLNCDRTLDTLEPIARELFSSFISS